jgi:iron only hydrogenase large subunit-like protein
MAESMELVEKGFLTSSCCPAFVALVRKKHPALVEHISHNLSPIGALGKHIKGQNPSAKVVFIGPCTAKKMEIRLDHVRPYVDAAITFEELQALFDARSIALAELEESPLDDASYYGRIFARSGGVSEAVRRALEERAIAFDLKPVCCAGIDACNEELSKAAGGQCPYNFIEGMACSGGCIGGAGCLTHSAGDRMRIEKYGKKAGDRAINRKWEC